MRARKIAQYLQLVMPAFGLLVLLSGARKLALKQQQNRAVAGFDVQSPNLRAVAHTAIGGTGPIAPVWGATAAGRNELCPADFTISLPGTKYARHRV